MRCIFNKIRQLLTCKVFRLLLSTVVGLIWLCTVLSCVFGCNIEGHMLMVLGLTFSFLIFLYQELNRSVIEKEKEKDDKDRDEKQKELLDKIGKNVLEIRPFREAFEVIPTLEEWLNNFEEENTLIFYFPYALCPGFWIDGGHGFMSYINKLEVFNQKQYKNKFILIGPAAKGQTMFTRIIEKLQSGNIEKINKSSGLMNLLNFTTVTEENKSDFIKRIKDLYETRLKQIEDIAKYKNFVKIVELKDTSKNLLSSSFVIKINRHNNQDVFFIDTFNFLSAKLHDLRANLGVESILNQDNGIEILFDNPKGRLINNNKIANLFLSMFLESCCNENLCNIKEEIFN